MLRSLYPFDAHECTQEPGKLREMVQEASMAAQAALKEKEAAQADAERLRTSLNR